MSDTKTPDVIEIILAISETIRKLHSVPSGTLYAAVMNNLSIQSYDLVIATLVRSRLVEKSSCHLLTWIGPSLGPRDEK